MSDVVAFDEAKAAESLEAFRIGVMVTIGIVKWSVEQLLFYGGRTIEEISKASLELKDAQESQRAAEKKLYDHMQQMESHGLDSEWTQFALLSSSHITTANYMMWSFHWYDPSFVSKVPTPPPDVAGILPRKYWYLDETSMTEASVTDPNDSRMSEEDSVSFVPDPSAGGSNVRLKSIAFW